MLVHDKPVPKNIKQVFENTPEQERTAVLLSRLMRKGNQIFEDIV